LAFLGTFLARRLSRKSTTWESFIFTILLYGAVYKIIAFLPELSTFPFSLAWSETSRYYYASLFFGERLYGMSVPASVLHPSRYLMQSLPFLLGNMPLWLHRLWQVILWITFSLLAAGMLLWRINRSAASDAVQSLTTEKTFKLAFILWAFLFFFQGPVYYHLLVMMILVLWGFDRERFWKTMVIVLLASLWAGISRVNWFPVPGLLASALFFLQVPVQGKSLGRYLWQPFTWTVSGTLAALLAQQLYILGSGNPGEQFSSSFTSDLLWYRLFPNPTYPLGILFSVVLVSLPLWIAIALRLYRAWTCYHPVRLLGLAAILFVLLAGGIVVSLKIGGGSNLHNLDAYLALLLVIGSYIGLGYFLEDREAEKVSRSPLSSRLLVTFVVALPVFFAISTGGQWVPQSSQVAQEALNTIKQAIQDKTTSDDRDVLFISQRHLLTFSDIQDVQLIPDYEKVFLMEMAMAGSETYLNSFYDDLKDQRYELIITDPLKIIFQGRSHSFGEENDAWVSRISEPVLCYYEPLITLTEIETEILVPRSQPCE
jgi:hypothetical protein